MVNKVGQYPLVYINLFMIIVENSWYLYSFKLRSHVLSMLAFSVKCSFV